MTLSELSSMVGVISGLAVLGSLIYLALQNRQIEKNQRALMNQGSINQISDNLRWVTEPRMAELLASLEAGQSQYTAAELQLLRARVRVLLLMIQDNYVQFKAGLVDQITWDNGLGTLKYLLAQPVYRALWKLHRDTYAPEWIAFIDKLMDETPLAKSIDTVARFNTVLAEVMR